MKTVTRLLLGTTAALALAGCSQLPGASLGSTFGAERYLAADHGGDGFAGALASEYTSVARRAADDVRWMNSTAYIAKAMQAEAGMIPAPWAPSEVGLGGEIQDLYLAGTATIAENAAIRPAACARAQAMWDQYLEALRGGDSYCIAPADARAMLDEALAACAGVATGDMVVYFGFDSTALTEAGAATLDSVVEAITGTGATAVSVVGHADTSGSAAYNQGLSERRARRVAQGLTERGVAPEAMTLAGRGEQDLAVATGDGVVEQLNRRVTIDLSN